MPWADVSGTDGGPPMSLSATPTALGHRKQSLPLPLGTLPETSSEHPSPCPETSPWWERSWATATVRIADPLTPFAAQPPGLGCRKRVWTRPPPVPRKDSEHPLACQEAWPWSAPPRQVRVVKPTSSETRPTPPLGPIGPRLSVLPPPREMRSAYPWPSEVVTPWRGAWATIGTNGWRFRRLIRQPAWQSFSTPALPPI